MHIAAKPLLVTLAGVQLASAFSPAARNTAGQGHVLSLVREPVKGELALGELAVNRVDRSIFFDPRNRGNHVLVLNAHADDLGASGDRVDAAKPGDTQGAEPIGEKYHALIDSCKTMSFGVSSPDGTKTELSYAPFVKSQSPLAFYVLGSQIAGASRALIDAADTGRPVAVAFMEPEHASPQPYARKRVMFQAKAERVEPRSPQWVSHQAKLRQRFGKIVDTLSSMPDFSMIRLVPVSGRYIEGFGKAFELMGDDLSLGQQATGGHARENGQDAA